MSDTPNLRPGATSTGQPGGTGGAPSSKPAIVHHSASIGTASAAPGAVERKDPAASPAGATPATGEPAGSSKIKAFAQSMGAGHHQEAWKRPTNVTGEGATHVRSFHCRLAAEGLEFLDKQINEWLDSHPDYEVKHVSITTGEWISKIKEPNLIVQVWV
ncbi:MAG: hypothetical protein AB7G11_10850 [Phycisphaerales bacterium]